MLSNYPLEEERIYSSFSSFLSNKSDTNADLSEIMTIVYESLSSHKCDWRANTADIIYNSPPEIQLRLVQMMDSIEWRGVKESIYDDSMSIPFIKYNFLQTHNRSVYEYMINSLEYSYVIKHFQDLQKKTVNTCIYIKKIKIKILCNYFFDRIINN